MKWNDIRKNVQYITRGSFDYLPSPGFCVQEGYKPTWTIDEEDHDGLYSFHKWFMKYYQDPTETLFVMNCFEGDFKHWEEFKNSRDIAPIYQQFKKEAEKKLLADAMQRIVEIAMDPDNKNSMTALKYLADRGAKIFAEPVNKGGRPKKSDVNKAAKEIAQHERELLKDLERIRG